MDQVFQFSHTYTLCLVLNHLLGGGGGCRAFLLLSRFDPNLGEGCGGLVPALFFLHRKCCEKVCMGLGCMLGDVDVDPYMVCVPVCLTAGLSPAPLHGNTEIRRVGGRV